MGRSLGDLRWAAGLYEGEGSAHLQRTKSRPERNVPRMSLSMTDEDVVRHFHEVMGFGTVYAAKMKNGRLIYTWHSGDRTMVPGILMTLYTFLGRRRRAKIREVVAGSKPYGYESRSRRRGELSSGAVLGPVGTSHHFAKLAEEDVRAIRAAYAAGGVTQKELAVQYGLNQSNIGALIRRETWASVA